MRKFASASHLGFTLIELAIVLVIVGLAIGGVLLGKDLIQAAKVRAQISQIQSYQAATRLFEIKFLGLPGDLMSRLASRFGFTSRGQYAGEGDGNGIIEGVYGDAPGYNFGVIIRTGETATFWVDLTYANGMNLNLIDGSFQTGSPNNPVGGFGAVINSGSTPNLASLFPHARLGHENYVYVYSNHRINYFGLSVLAQISGAGDNWLASPPGATVQEAFSMDQKIDDGLPQTGRVIASYVNTAVASPVVWASGGGTYGWGGLGASDESATPGSATTCFDNNNVAGTTQHYSLSQNNGTGMNCGLSFEFQ